MKKEILKNSAVAYLFVMLYFVQAQAAQPCSKEWALDGQMKTKSYVYGLGLSTNSDSSSASQEAKNQAMKDVSAQLLSNVQSDSKISETEQGSSYAAEIKVQSNLSNLTGMKVVKEGSDPQNKITSCIVVKYDAAAAYTDAEGKMNVLMNKLKDVTFAAKQKKYVEVLQKRRQVKATIAEAISDIGRADMFLMYLKADDETWYQKIKNQEIEIDRVADQAKSNIVFLIPENPFEGALSDIESRISSQGFEVIRTGRSPKTVTVAIDLKQIGAPRKTKTPLGITYVSKIMVTIKEGSKTIGTNKGGDVLGSGSTEDDALANIDRQLVTQILSMIDVALPGLLENE